MKILLVEDNPDHRELMRLVLTEYDATWQVEGVVSGEEALCHLAEGEAYDVVFLDYSLPGRDGLDVLEEIRRCEVPPPVVMVTGRGDEQVAVRAMKGGAYDYVVKGEGYLQRLPVVAQRAMKAQQLVVERERAEEALRESEERFAQVADQTREMIWEVDAEGLYTYVSRGCELIMGYKPEEVVRKIHFCDLHPEEGRDAFKRTVFAVFERGEPFHELPNAVMTKDGREVWVSTNGIPILDTQGNLIGYRGSDHDITGRKLAEESLKASLREKEVLFKEIHHRVKNNLQVISSLLDLESEHARGKEALDVLRATRNRVLAMALIHEKLYLSHDIANILIDEYIESIVQHLYETYEGFARNTSLKVNAEPITVPIDIVIPCGLIISELVSNAMKYAFPDNPAGDISISFYKKEGAFVLSVADNGAGLPPDIEINKTHTLGLRLVHMLTGQLKGTIECERTGGTRWTITF